MSSQSHRCSSYSKRSSQQSSISSHMSKQASSVVSEMIKSESITQNLHAESSSVKNFTQKVSSNSSISSSVTVTSNNFGVDTVDFRDKNELMPPAIPQKTRRKQDRQSSPYDNVTDGK